MYLKMALISIRTWSQNHIGKCICPFFSCVWVGLCPIILTVTDSSCHCFRFILVYPWVSILYLEIHTLKLSVCTSLTGVYGIMSKASFSLGCIKYLVIGVIIRIFNSLQPLVHNLHIHIHTHRSPWLVQLNWS